MLICSVFEMKSYALYYIILSIFYSVTFYMMLYYIILYCISRRQVCFYKSEFQNLVRVESRLDKNGLLLYRLTCRCFPCFAFMTMCLNQCQIKEKIKKRYGKFNLDTNFVLCRQFCQEKGNENLLYMIFSTIYFKK